MQPKNLIWFDLIWSVRFSHQTANTGINKKRLGFVKQTCCRYISTVEIKFPDDPSEMIKEGKQTEDGWEQDAE